jgi:hypothetical protein
MSITKDIRSYADSAFEQGKQVLDQAQTQLTDVTGQANDLVGKFTGTAWDNVSEFTGQANDLVGKFTGTAWDNVSEFTAKATGAVHDLRTQAEKAVNLDAIRVAVEPYLAQAKGYSNAVTDRVEEFYATLWNDKRVAKLVSTAESLTGVVVETVQVRVVKPVQSLTGLGSTPAAKPAAPKAAPKAAAAKPAVTKPAVTKPAPATTATTARTTARKAPAKKAAAKS